MKIPKSKKISTLTISSINCKKKRSKKNQKSKQNQKIKSLTQQNTKKKINLQRTLMRKRNKCFDQIQTITYNKSAYTTPEIRPKKDNNDLSIFPYLTFVKRWNF